MQQQQQQQQQAPLGSFNSSKIKLSQIQVKPKSSSSLLNQKSDSNTNISGGGGGGGTENASNSSSAPSSAKTTTTSALNETSNTHDENKTPLDDEAAKTSREEARKAEQALISLKNKRYEETPLSKPQGLYTYAVTSSCQLRESFYNNRSLINTSSNCTNQIIYNRSDSFLNSSSSNEELNLTDNNTNANYALPSPIEEIKNTKKNRRLFKDLDFIYNEQQVFKLSRQIWFQIRTNKYRTAQNRLNENHLNQYLDQLNNSSMLINKLYNYDVYKFYERAKISLLIKCLQPLKSNFNRSGYNSGGAGLADAQTNHIMRNINNISNLSSANMGGASSSSIAATTTTTGHYMIDKDLVFVKKDSSMGRGDTGKNLTIEEENSDEEAKRNEVIDRELFYAELEEASKLGEENDEDDLDEDDDSDSLKNEDADSLETSANMNRKSVKTNLNASNGLLSLKHAS